MNQNKKLRSLPARLACAVFAAVLALSLCGCADMAAAIWEAISWQGGAPEASQSQSSQSGSADAQSADCAFKMHFIDVGQALSVLVECDGQFMLYDGGNVDDSSLLVSYLQSHGVDRLEYIFCSHVHEDHAGGLAAALARFAAGHVYSPVAEAESTCFEDFKKYAQKQGLQLETPAAGAQWALGSAAISLLGPVRQYEDANNTSLVLRIDYGATSFLLTGDMEAEAELDLVESGVNLKADVLQVGHHGSSTSTGYVFLNAVMPEFAVISCGAGNDYGHPHDEVLSRLRDAGADTYRTDLMGTITIASDGANYIVGYERSAGDSQLNPTLQSASAQAQEQPAAGSYIGNLKSKKFHSPGCKSLPAEKNRVLFSTYDEAVAAGYIPHTECVN